MDPAEAAAADLQLVLRHLREARTQARLVAERVRQQTEARQQRIERRLASPNQQRRT